MADTRRCSQCSTNWPVMETYLSCPICISDTWLCTKEDSVLTRVQAEQLVKAHRDEYQRQEDQDRVLDAAFDGWFCRDNGIVNPAVALADRNTMAPLDELVC